MKIIITEQQYQQLFGNDEKVLIIPDLEAIGGWDVLQSILKRKNNPPFIIDSNTDLRDMEIENLGKLRGVNGDLLLGGNSKLYSLGELRYVKGDLGLDYCSLLKSLDNLETVSGSLELMSCYELTTLNKLKYVGGSLNLEYTIELNSFGDLVTVGDWIYLGMSNIKKHPLFKDKLNKIKIKGRTFLS